MYHIVADGMMVVATTNVATNMIVSIAIGQLVDVGIMGVVVVIMTDHTMIGVLTATDVMNMAVCIVICQLAMAFREGAIATAKWIVAAHSATR